MTTDEIRFWNKVRIGDGCWTWTAAKTRDGYGQFWSAGRAELAHRVALRGELGAFDRCLLVLHRCDNPSCVRPGHLFLGTDADNNADMIAKGRNAQPKGERHGRAVLTEAAVREIRASYAGGEPIASLARRMGVAWTTAKDVLTGRRWSHVA